MLATKYLENTIGFIMPAFESVSEDVSIYEVNHSYTNVFYKEYGKAIELAKKILMRFGFNIGNINQHQILTPPFWIDMSKLFEIYVLALLKERFNSAVKYHFRAKGNELDYLLKTAEYSVVIDAKYKILYRENNEWDIDNIRQISGYARLRDVYSKLDKPYTEILDCLIIYPGNLVDMTEYEVQKNQFLSCDLLKNELSGLVQFYKLAVPIPVVMEFQ
jgi:5-methylcytosine-specific restriction enzyme subunit McrC